MNTFVLRVVCSFFCCCILYSTQPAFAQGALAIEIAGLPYSDAGVIITGPANYSKKLNHTDTLRDLVSGKYVVLTHIKTYLTVPFNQNFRTEKFRYEIDVSEKEASLRLQFREMPASKALYIANQNAASGKKIIAFSMENIKANGKAGADIALTGSITSPRAMAFDKNGNLWVVDGAGLLKMFSWFALKTSNSAPAQTMKVSNPHGITFDPYGNLWCTTSTSVMMFPVLDDGSISTSQRMEIRSTEFKGVRGLAFDERNNLWLANSGNNNLLMIRKENLRSSGNLIPDRKVTFQSLPPVKMTLSSPNSVSVDIKGNLYVGFFGPNVIAKISVDELSGGDTITPKVQITLATSVLLDQMSIDNDNSLWVQLGAGKFGKIAVEDLRSAGKKNPAIIIESDDLKYGSGIAFYNPNLFKDQ